MSKRAVVDFEIKGASGITMIKQLETRVRTLRREWRNSENAVDRYKKEVEFKQANNELRRHRKRIYDTDTAWQKFKKTALPITTGVLGANLVTFASSLLTNVIPQLTRRTAALDDELADIMKTTGMLKSEVVDLTDELNKLDTKTSRQELRRLAVQAGRLGKNTKEDVLEFVESADMINVSLNELGEEGVLSIGKVADAFDISMIQVGSAINSLGAASAAQETYLVDFLARLGGTGKTAGIAAADILGYGAVLDSLGLQVEMSSTALNNFFIDFTKNTASFEQAASMANGSLSKLIGEKGTNEGFLTFLEVLKETSSSKADFLKRLEEVGIKGSREAQVIQTLANNIGKVRDQQELSNREFEKGTSLLDEFNIKNTTTAATLAKISKWWDSFYENGGINGFIDTVVGSFGKLIGVIDQSDLELKEFAEQYGNVKQLEKNLNPLIARHDELKSKTKLSKEEQIELNKIIGKIAESVPYAVTEVDKYGVALGISTDRAKEFVEQQRAMLRVQNADYIKSLNSELKDLKSNYDNVSKLLEAGIVFGGASGGVGARAVRRKATIQEMAEMRKRQQELGQQMREKQLALDGFQGNFPEVPTASGTTIPTTTPTGSEDDKGGGSGESGLPKSKESRIKKSFKATLDLESTLLTLKYGAIANITKSGEEGISKIIEDAKKKNIENNKEFVRIDIQESMNTYLYELEQRQKQEEFALEMRSINSLANQDLINQQKLELQENYLVSEYLLKEALGIRDIELEDNLNELRKNKMLEMHQFEQSLINEKIQAEEELALTKQDAVLSGISSLRSLLNETSVAYKALFVIEKAMAIGQIITANMREVAFLRAAQAANVAAASATVAGVALVPGINALYNAKVTKARISAGIRVGTIAAQAFGEIAKKEEGGFTDMESLGYTQGPKLFGSISRPYIAGEKGQEFVTSFQSLQNPVVANFTQLLDAAQKSGDYSNLNGLNQDKALSGAVLKEMQSLNANISKLGGRPINFNFDKFQKYSDFLYDIKKSVTA